MSNPHLKEEYLKKVREQMAQSLSIDIDRSLLGDFAAMGQSGMQAAVAARQEDQTGLTMEKLAEAKETMEKMHSENWRSLLSCEEGEFIQTKERLEHESDYPPPIFYVGKKDITSINILCLHTLKWRTIENMMYVLSRTPEVTEEMRLSIVPFLELEPVLNKAEQEFSDTADAMRYTMMKGRQQGASAARGLFSGVGGAAGAGLSGLFGGKTKFDEHAAIIHNVTV